MGNGYIYIYIYIYTDYVILMLKSVSNLFLHTFFDASDWKSEVNNGNVNVQVPFILAA